MRQAWLERKCKEMIWDDNYLEVAQGNEMVFHKDEEIVMLQ